MRRFRKTVSVGDEVTSEGGGRLFQRRLPATGNARSPTVDSRVYVGSPAVRMTTTGDSGGWNVIVVRETMQASVNEHSQLEIDAFQRPQKLH